MAAVDDVNSIAIALEDIPLGRPLRQKRMLSLAPKMICFVAAAIGFSNAPI